ncbi:uncharacterized protein MYCFIDRAFT_180061 [Pseudocercospora fijiensis CIRAD86]|uniref:Uncharacterized protein n=1 Tax=Pseudocercospora fijiensis (strain CIRAD86) TaxID=383855 RepID=M2ZDL0_PSEFD|nr:uncharacterized protein MYCFIDRAFT_180061 [Pseudocercospora fijiensis CIRAD86]EME77184.1 hypothetical protein MYCFIDRAFT_180061 [Pseudocercospora fijiensis CIRAD86]
MRKTAKRRRSPTIALLTEEEQRVLARQVLDEQDFNQQQVLDEHAEDASGQSLRDLRISVPDFINMYTSPSGPDTYVQNRKKAIRKDLKELVGKPLFDEYDPERSMQRPDKKDIAVAIKEDTPNRYEFWREDAAEEMLGRLMPNKRSGEWKRNTPVDKRNLDQERVIMIDTFGVFVVTAGAKHRCIKVPKILNVAGSYAINAKAGRQAVFDLAQDPHFVVAYHKLSRPDIKHDQTLGNIDSTFNLTTSLSAEASSVTEQGLTEDKLHHLRQSQREHCEILHGPCPASPPGSPPAPAYNCVAWSDYRNIIASALGDIQKMLEAGQDPAAVLSAEGQAEADTKWREQKPLERRRHRLSVLKSTRYDLQEHIRSQCARLPLLLPPTVPGIKELDPREPEKLFLMDVSVNDETSDEGTILNLRHKEDDSEKLLVVVVGDQIAMERCRKSEAGNERREWLSLNRVLTLLRTYYPKSEPGQELARSFFKDAQPPGLPNSECDEKQFSIVAMFSDESMKRSSLGDIAGHSSLLHKKTWIHKKALPRQRFTIVPDNAFITQSRFLIDNSVDRCRLLSLSRRLQDSSIYGREMMWLHCLLTDGIADLEVQEALRGTAVWNISGNSVETYNSDYSLDMKAYMTSTHEVIAATVRRSALKREYKDFLRSMFEPGIGVTSTNSHSAENKPLWRDDIGIEKLVYFVKQVSHANYAGLVTDHGDLEDAVLNQEVAEEYGLCLRNNAGAMGGGRGLETSATDDHKQRVDNFTGPRHHSSAADRHHPRLQHLGFAVAIMNPFPAASEEIDDAFSGVFHLTAADEKVLMLQTENLPALEEERTTLQPLCYHLHALALGSTHHSKERWRRSNAGLLKAASSSSSITSSSPTTSASSSLESAAAEEERWAAKSDEMKSLHSHAGWRCWPKDGQIAGEYPEECKRKYDCRNNTRKHHSGLATTLKTLHDNASAIATVTPTRRRITIGLRLRKLTDFCAPHILPISNRQWANESRRHYTTSTFSGAAACRRTLASTRVLTLNHTAYRLFMLLMFQSSVSFLDRTVGVCIALHLAFSSLSRRVEGVIRTVSSRAHLTKSSVVSHLEASRYSAHAPSVVVFVLLRATFRSTSASCIRGWGFWESGRSREGILALELLCFDTRAEV